MRPPRGLSPDEAALWHRIAATVRPLHPKPARKPAAAVPQPPAIPPPPAPRVRGRVPPPAVAPAPPPPPPPSPKRPLDRNGLDASWDRKLARGALDPDLTIDLHGHTQDTAHARLDFALAEARATGARILLVITGKPRPATERDARGNPRGTIRAQLLDWLAAGPHAGAIAAVRNAQPRHGGAGAVYVVLRKARL